MRQNDSTYLTLIKYTVSALIVSVVLSACTDLDVVSRDQSRVDPVGTSSGRDLPGSTSEECNGDTNTPTLVATWNLHWQHVFDHPIARPPEVSNSQVILLEREDPFPGQFKDTLWLLDPQNGSAVWQYEDVQGSQVRVARRIYDIAWSEKYLALYVLYEEPSSVTANREPYIVVVDRSSNQIVFQTQPLLVQEMSVSNDALYFRDALQGFLRIDLPGGEQRWVAVSEGGRGYSGLFPSDSLLYAFNVDRNVYQHNSQDGTLIATTFLGIAPNLGDVFVQDQEAIIRSSYPNEVVALFDLQSFRIKWSTNVSYLDAKRSNAFWNSAPSIGLTSDSVYLFDAQDNLLRLSLATGEVMWQTLSPGVQAMARPIAIHDIVYGLYADGTLRAYSVANGSQVDIVMQVPLWYRRQGSPIPQRDLVGGLAAAGDTLIVTTGCRSVYAIRHEN